MLMRLTLQEINKMAEVFPELGFKSLVDTVEQTGKAKFANQVAKWAVSWRDDISQEALDALISIIEEANNG